MAVALRVAEPQGPAASEARAQLVSDSLAVAALAHSGFVPILQAAELESSCFVAMALIEHQSLLARAVEAHGLDASDALGIVGRVAEALDAAHAANLVHGRLCARRVLMAGSRPYVGGVGFGQRGPWDAPVDQLDTLDGVAPEQIDDRGAIDRRTDVYALGCLLVRVLSGAPPFPRDNAEEVLNAHLSDPPSAFGGAAERWDRELDEVIATALAKEPADRYATCADLVSAARAALMPGKELGQATPRRVDPADPSAIAAANQPQGAGGRENGTAPAAEEHDRRPAPIEADTEAPAEDPVASVAASDLAEPGAGTEEGREDAAARDEAERASVPVEDPAAQQGAEIRGEHERSAAPAGSGTAQDAGGRGASDAQPNRSRGRRPLALALLSLALIGAVVLGLVLAGREGDPRERPQAEAPQRRSAARPAASAPAPVPAPALRASAPVALGGSAAAFALIPGGVWVADPQRDVLLRLDRRGRPLEQRVPVEGDPSAITSGAGGLWVASAGTDTVTNLDSRQGTALGAPIAVGDDPQAVALGARSVWVANRGDGTLSRIDRATGQVGEAPVPVGAQPSAVATTEEFVWVANRGDGTVSRIDIATRRPTGEPIRVGAAPEALAVGARSVWVANAGDGTVSRISVRRGRVLGEPIQVGGRPAAIAFGGRYVWVADAARRLVVRLRSSDGRLAGLPIQLSDPPSRIRIGTSTVWVLSATGTITRIPFAR